jgi:SAM-dependent methyltransferase
MMDEFDVEAKLYDRVWGTYDYDNDVKFLTRLFQKHGCRTIVDVGCGTGNHALGLSKIGYEVTGIDISPAMLRMAKKKDRGRKIQFIKGDMKDLGSIEFDEKKKFDAAISLGQVSSHLYTDQELKVFLDGLSAMLRKGGLFVLGARNASRINDEYLNRVILNRLINEEEMQLALLAQNSRDADDPNILVWRPIYLMKENGRVDFQVREHRLRWFEFSTLRKLLKTNGFEVEAVYSGPSGEKFNEHVHDEMWFVATTR